LVELLMKTKQRYLRAFAAIAVLMLSSCGDHGYTTLTIGGLVFRMPEQSIRFPQTPKWWPFGQQREGFNFVIDPEEGDPQTYTISVVIAPMPERCVPWPTPEYNQLLRACIAAKRGVHSVEDTKGRLEKNYPDPTDETQWRYIIKRNGADSRVDEAAGCSGSPEIGIAGSCLTISNYKNLVYSIRFRDSEINKLTQLNNMVNERLASWEQPAVKR
jgi:hypothetical protein